MKEQPPRWQRALISGASAGIGEAFARRIAPYCEHLTLVARRTERLEALAAELAPHTEVAVLGADLAQLTGVAAVVEHIRQWGPVDLLINNAGFSTLGPFAQSDLDSELAMVQLHQNATLALTRAALPSMIEGGRGAIINVASVAAYVALPGVATYGGTKAFLTSYSQSLAAELAGSGVQVQCLCPGYTRTEIHTRPSFAAFDRDRVPEHLWMESDEVVTASLEGLAAERWLVVPGAVNRKVVRRALGSIMDSLDQTGGAATAPPAR